jgi:hypothetical protein
MKSIPSKRPAQRPAARKAATKKSAPPPAPPAAVRKKPVPKPPIEPPPRDEKPQRGSKVRPGGLERELLEEVRALRAAVMGALREPIAVDADGDLEATVDSMRRLLSEWMERRTDQLLEDLAAIRDAIADPDSVDQADGLRQIDGLFDRLGAVPFSGGNLDFVDPAIHEIVAERSLAHVPDGVVVETLRPGLRGAGGGLVRKARVAVNRRGADESPGH